MNDARMQALLEPSEQRGAVLRLQGRYRGPILSGGKYLVRDLGDETHLLTHKAVSVLRLALLALDARLRPGGVYRERADELYTMLAAVEYEAAISELRRVFTLPWVMRNP